MLIKCPECGKEVSDKASTCTDCGYPLTQRKEESSDFQIKRRDGLVVTMNVILGMFSFMMFYGVLMSEGGVSINQNAAIISWFAIIGSICTLVAIKKRNKIASRASGILLLIAGIVCALSLTIAPAYLLLCIAICINIALSGKYLKNHKIY